MFASLHRVPDRYQRRSGRLLIPSLLVALEEELVILRYLLFAKVATLLLFFTMIVLSIHHSDEECAQIGSESLSIQTSQSRGPVSSAPRPTRNTTPVNQAALGSGKNRFACLVFGCTHNQWSTAKVPCLSLGPKTPPFLGVMICFCSETDLHLKCRLGRR